MPVVFQNRLAVSLHLSLLTFHTCFIFHIPLNPPFPTQFSRHILSNVFHLTLYISVVFQKRKCCVVSVVSRVKYIFTFIKLQTSTHHIFPNVHTLVM